MYRLTTLGKLSVGHVLGAYIIGGQLFVWGNRSGIGPVFSSFNTVLGFCFILLCPALYFITKHFVPEEKRQDEWYSGEVWLLQTVEKFSLLDIILLSGLPVVWIAYILWKWLRNNALRDGILIEKVEDSNGNSSS